MAKQVVTELLVYTPIDSQAFQFVKVVMAPLVHEFKVSIGDGVLTPILFTLNQNYLYTDLTCALLSLNLH